MKLAAIFCKPNPMPIPIVQLKTVNAVVSTPIIPNVTKNTIVATVTYNVFIKISLLLGFSLEIFLILFSLYFSIHKDVITKIISAIIVIRTEYTVNLNEPTVNDKPSESKNCLI